MLIYDPDSRFGGMLFFYDENGKRHKQTFGGSVNPDVYRNLNKPALHLPVCLLSGSIYRQAGQW